MLERGDNVQERARPDRLLERLPRLLATVYGEEAGPTVVITGGLHGNEPAGVLAALELLERLEPLRHALRGRVFAFAGNRGALARGLRFLDRDLNRGWDARSLERLERTPASALAREDREQRELLDAFLAIEEDLQRDGTPPAFVDLHTTSGPTRPFACLGSSIPSRRLARALPIASVVGLERAIPGTMLAWCTSRGHVAMSIEAGRHDDPASPRRHVSALFLLLSATGALDTTREPRLVEHLEEHRAALARESHGSPRVYEVRHRHVVVPGDGFEMLPGFESFDPVEVGQILARDRRGPIRAPESGVILMPRYQGQGEDGFFIARDAIARDPAPRR